MSFMRKNWRNMIGYFVRCRYRKTGKHRIIFISDADRELVQSLKMIPAHNIEEALDIAKELLGYDGTITVIPEGISTYIEKEYD